MSIFNMNLMSRFFFQTVFRLEGKKNGEKCVKKYTCGTVQWAGIIH